jgi:hypothetical protein
MNSVKAWFDRNVDKKQMVTIIVSSAAIGTAVYAARKTGFGKVANVVKGG